VSGSFGGGVLSRLKRQAVALSGERKLTFASNRRAVIARLLIVVLKGLGGAPQEDQQPALVLIAKIGDALGEFGTSAFCF
jgi:hypothetical protein